MSLDFVMPKGLNDDIFTFIKYLCKFIRVSKQAILIDSTIIQNSVPSVGPNVITNYFIVESLKPSHLPSANLFYCYPLIYGGDKLFESFHNFQHILFILSGTFNLQQIPFILSGTSPPLIYTHTKIYSIVFERQGGVLFLYYIICILWEYVKIYRENIVQKCGKNTIVYNLRP